MSSSRVLLAAACFMLLATLTSCSGGTVSAAPDPVAAAAAPTATVAANPTPDAPVVDADAALARLQAGNLRYVTGNNYCYARTEDRPQYLNAIQHPIAVVVACSDSRIDPQLAFDQAWGQLFVTRLAGNVTDSDTLGSAEYAVAVLGTRLLVVLGHQGCGAVDAAVKGKPLPGYLQGLVARIVPAVDAVRNQPGDLLANAIDANVRQSMQALAEDPVIAPTVGPGGTRIVGAVYQLETGTIRWLP